MSDLNIIRWLWKCPCVHFHGMTTSARAPWRFLYHTHYIFSYLNHHFLIDVYGIFLYLHRTIYYLRTMSAYKLFISISYHSVFVFYSISSYSVSMMDSIPPLFYPALSTFTTWSLVDGGPICRLSMCFRTMITSQKISKRYSCRYSVKTYSSVCPMLQYVIDIFLLSTLSLEN